MKKKPFEEMTEQELADTLAFLKAKDYTLYIEDVRAVVFYPDKKTVSITIMENLRLKEIQSIIDFLTDVKTIMK